MLLCFALGDLSGQCQSTLPYLNPTLTPEKRAADLVSRMTLEEKVSQMQNHCGGDSAAGRAAVRLVERGAARRGARRDMRRCFRRRSGWRRRGTIRLMHTVATTISTEARAKYNEAMRDDDHSIYCGLTFWSPNINIFRDPRWGRGQETYGEDPFLTGQHGRGVRRRDCRGTIRNIFKMIATPKHFAVHSGPESTRHRFECRVSPHDLEDTYLPAFRATVTEGHADSMMCAYNAIDGAPACANTMLLEKTLREDWGFNGYVVSDCGAIGDIYREATSLLRTWSRRRRLAVQAGTDLSCGNEYAALVEAVKRRADHGSDDRHSGRAAVHGAVPAGHVRSAGSECLMRGFP